MRTDLLSRLESTVADVQHPKVMRVALWVMGQFAESKEAIRGALAAVRDTLGSLPLTEPHVEPTAAPLVDTPSQAGDALTDSAAEASTVPSTREESKEAAAGAGAGAGAGTSKGPKILADGSYATQSAMTEVSASAASSGGASGAGNQGPALRRLLLSGRGDWYLASTLASTLTKLALRAGDAFGTSSGEAKSAVVDALLVMTAVLEVGQE